MGSGPVKTGISTNYLPGANSKRGPRFGEWKSHKPAWFALRVAWPFRGSSCIGSSFAPTLCQVDVLRRPDVVRQLVFSQWSKRTFRKRRHGRVGIATCSRLFGLALGLCMGDICKTWKAAVRLRIAALAESRYVPVRALEPYAALFEFWTKCGLRHALQHRTASTEDDQAPGLRIAVNVKYTSSATGGRRADAHRLSRQIRRPIRKRFRRGYNGSFSAAEARSGAWRLYRRSEVPYHEVYRSSTWQKQSSELRLVLCVSCGLAMLFFEAGAASREIPRLGNMQSRTEKLPAGGLSPGPAFPLAGKIAQHRGLSPWMRSLAAPLESIVTCLAHRLLLGPAAKALWCMALTNSPTAIWWSTAVKAFYSYKLGYK